MSVAQPVEVKVVYSASRRGRGSVVQVHRASGGGTGSLVLGLVSALVVCGLYYGIWWEVDPELHFMVIMHTPLAGLDLQGVGELMSQAMAAKSQGSAVGSVSLGTTDEVAAAQMRQAAHFVGTAVGWELLAALSISAMAMFAGGLVAQADAPRLRRAARIAALMALAAGMCAAVALWFNYGGFEPKQWRTDVGILVVIAALLGMALRRSGRKLGAVSAFLLIISAASSAYLLHVLVQFGAVKVDDLPAELWPCMGVLFLIHSLWGWILLAWVWRSAL